MSNKPIELGTLLFTMVEPRKGHEVAYNRWYETDHFYGGCLVGANTFAGDRFVATRELKKLRYPAETPMTPDPQTGSYLAIYWVLKGFHDEWNRWSVDTVKNLHATGRMFTERDHIHTLLYNHEWSIQNGERNTPVEQALDRNFKGIIINVGELAPGKSHADIEAWTRDCWAPRAMSKKWGPELILNSTPLPLLDDAPPDVPRTANADRRFMQIHFVDRDPRKGWDKGYAKYGEALNESGIATHLWTAPFIQTVFGTDKYTDQL
ncbi:MAG: hypothetical protein WCO15_04755 [Actinomycetota bacterium]